MSDEMLFKDFDEMMKPPGFSGPRIQAVRPMSTKPGMDEIELIMNIYGVQQDEAMKIFEKKMKLKRQRLAKARRSRKQMEELD